MGERIARWRHKRYLEQQYQREQQEARDRAELLPWQRTGLPRRKLGRIAAGVGIGVVGGASKLAELFVAVDQQTRKDNDQNAPTRLEIVDACRSWFPPKQGEKVPGELVITVPGLGIVNGIYPADQMAIEGFNVNEERTSPMTYLISSLEGKKIEEVADIIQAIVESEVSEGLSFYGQSNGSIVILEALHYLKKEREIVVPVKRLILNCSPYDYDDVQEGGLEKFFGRIFANSQYKPGALSKFLFQMRENQRIDRGRLFGSIFEAARDSWHEATEGEPPDPWKADLRILINSRLDDYDLSGIITEDTQVLFTYSEHDDVVRNSNSSRRYRDKFRRSGLKDENFTEVPLPDGAGHADPRGSGIAARPWIERTSPRSGPQPV